MSNLIELLGIKTVSVSQAEVIISLEVTDSVKQPYGILHGGINSVLAETAASIGANERLDNSHYAVGVDITTQHLLPVFDGKLVATATPLHAGGHLQTWRVAIHNGNRLTSFSTVTLTNVAQKS
ncbi:PaaI family thioesterase [Lentilactobacillus buchneri]|uniref:Aromatic compounds catabolism protein n=2 Tax=Lentilactobacillus buchneri TaxID=1581 RepID=J9VYY6_LENBU|nr:PaaI family thioesterase [Lentilactobacillus buchneri]MCC6100933.1 PaaI family thioesterase [Lactobacillus sp.]WCJ51109.1 PaaI family thioesterase [Lentilactobacillus sp. Egmn17]AEB72587.1 phenylacetic acid degradation-related protein [Lentilactobacillus buchneri NRRL B-30929]AFR99448.1 aromatic compounds catabolism protein [Lentilactobacillus buchneri subsp. silagei CD034]MCT2881334.1 PaaI family thioesterase [Lentilactobacillus buchneri]